MRSSPPLPHRLQEPVVIHPAFAITIAQDGDTIGGLVLGSKRSRARPAKIAFEGGKRARWRDMSLDSIDQLYQDADACARCIPGIAAGAADRTLIYP